MKTVKLHFNLKPQTKLRPRLSVRGRGKRRVFKAFTPKKTVIFETHVKDIALDYMAKYHLQPFTGPLEVSIWFYMPRPRTPKNPKSKNWKVHHISTPDLDNLVKAVLDGLQGSVFVDDKTIVSLAAHKLYDEYDSLGHVEVLIGEKDID